MTPVPGLHSKKIAIVGIGKIGGTIASGLLKNKIVPPAQLVGSTRRAEHNREVSKRLGIKMYSNNQEMVAQSDVVILAVKPQTMRGVLEEIKKVIRGNHLVITLAAATNTKFIEDQLNAKVPVIRAMPNTPCLVNAGMTVLCTGR